MRYGSLYGWLKRPRPKVSWTAAVACGADPLVEVESEVFHDVVGDDVDIGVGFGYFIGNNDERQAKLARAG